MFTLSINGLSAFLTLGVHVLLARSLGHESYSDYAYVLTWLTILAVPGVFGMDTAAQRFVAAYHAVADWPTLLGFLRQSTRTVLCSSLSLVVLCSSLLLFFGESMRPELARVFWVGILALPCTSLLLLGVAILRGLHSPALASLPRLVVRPALLAGAIALSSTLVGDELQGHDAMLADFGATTAALGLAAFLIRRQRPRDLLSCEASTKTKEWLFTSLPMLGIALMQLMIRSTDAILLGYFHGTAMSGPYSAAARIALLAAFGLMAVNAVLPPLIARNHARGELRDLQRLVTLAARVTFAFSVLASVTIILFRDSVLEFFGPEFGQASRALLILCCAQLVNALSGSVGFVLSMTGNHRIVVRVLLCTTVAHAALCVALIPTYGIEGAAWATASATAVSNIVLAYCCTRVLSIDPSVFGFRKARHGA